MTLANDFEWNPGVYVCERVFVILKLVLELLDYDNILERIASEDVVECVLL
jgi:hypothetical protein